MHVAAGVNLKTIAYPKEALYPTEAVRI